MKRLATIVSVLMFTVILHAEETKKPMAKPYLISFSPLTLSSTEIPFTIRNTGKKPISIIWDESTLIDPRGQSQRIIHSRVRLIDKDTATQTPSVVAPGSSISDFVSPTANIFYSDKREKWMTLPLFVVADHPTRDILTDNPHSIAFFEHPLTKSECPSSKNCKLVKVSLYLVLKVGEIRMPEKFTIYLDPKLAEEEKKSWEEADKKQELNDKLIACEADCQSKLPKQSSKAEDAAFELCMDSCRTARRAAKNQPAEKDAAPSENKP